MNYDKTLEPPNPPPPATHEVSQMVVTVLNDIGITQIMEDCPEIAELLRGYYRNEVIAAIVEEYGCKEEDIAYESL